ncbi:3-deoxy-D-manno-octulosonic acid transferase [Terrarubrum flagellatum]|uniref:3-deoxy-D-manno-octulosonic acid transferase n=1 Tax=Terrirubrum flagellatum TaxID=2895980 RepID=UPI003145303E
MTRRPLALAAYALATRAAAPLAGRFLEWRTKRGKEDRERRGERFGVASLPRPNGRLVWMHGASNGETMSLLPLVDRFRAQDFRVLVTSGTIASASLMQRRLPPGAVHQYLPLDSPRFVDRFLAHWQPEVAIFAESELWPNLIMQTHRAGASLMLVNARMSERSFQRWRRAPSIIGGLLNHIDLVMAQSDPDAFRYGALGAQNVVNAGNLKFDAPPPPADAMKLAAMSAAVAGRAVWLAASTHPGEDEEIIAAHRLIASRIPDMLTIIVPRHPHRGADICEIARLEGHRAALRTRDGLPARDTEIYVADTTGELGLFFRLSPIAFIGATLVDKGGHNPIEPAKLGVAILHGPHVRNAADTYAALDREGGAIEIVDAKSIAQQVISLIGDVGPLRAMGEKAFAAVGTLAGATDRCFAAMAPFLEAKADAPERA